jgi:hypothetical protein
MTEKNKKGILMMSLFSMKLSATLDYRKFHSRVENTLGVTCNKNPF